MPMINFTEPLQLFVALLLFVLTLWLFHQGKKSAIMGIMLFIFISSLALHSLEFTMGNLTDVGASATIRSAVFDLIFIFLSFISYLWIDDIEAKEKKKKIVDNSLEWFWSKI